MHRNKIHIQCSKKDRVRADVVDIVGSIIKNEFTEADNTLLIVVGGPGGTGKSTFSSELQEALIDASVLRLDDYKTPRSVRATLNIYGAHPMANEMKLLSKHFSMLSKGESIEKPVYNSTTGISDTTELFTPKKYVILDGEVSTYSEFTPYIDFSIFIDSDWRTQLNTRVSRDIDARNYDKEKAIATFLHSNIKEFEEYGASSKNTADVHLYCENDYRLTLESMTEPLFNKYGPLLSGGYSRVGLKGFILAALTPFSSDGNVNTEAFVEHLHYLHELGVHRILVGGMTGEFFLLSPEERRDLLAAASQYFPGYIIYNVTSLSLKEIKEHIRMAEELGADAVCALPPLAPLGVSDIAIEAYYRELADCANCFELPFMIYNNPACCQNTLNNNVLENLSDLYIKDSAKVSDLGKHSKRYFCGEDSRISESVKDGSIGFISGAANAAPELYLNIEKAIIIDDEELVAASQIEINKHLAALASESDSMNNLCRKVINKHLPNYPISSRTNY